MKPKVSTTEMMNAGGTLLLLAQESMALAQKIVEARGELTPEIEELLEVNASNISRKLDSYVWITDQADTQAALWKRKAQACQAIAKGFEKVGERLNERIKFVMGEMKVDELAGAEYRFKLSRVKPKMVIDEEVLPAEYLMQVAEMVPDKERIRTALEEGFQIPGCHLEEVTSLRTYEHKEG